MRLLFFIYSLSGGGAERVTANLANYWAQQGWEIIIATLASTDQDTYELSPSIKRIALDLAKASSGKLDGVRANIQRVHAVRRVLKTFKPDVAIGIMDSASVILALASAGLPKLVTIGTEHIHPPRQKRGGGWNVVRYVTYRQLDAVVALTQRTAAWIAAHTLARRTPVIPNPIQWPLPTREPHVDPNTVCSVGRKMLLAVGRLDKQKGFDWLLEAFSGLAARHPTWDLVIIGEGSERTQLEKHIRNSSLGARILLPGWVGNLADWYASADIYVMSSRYEGFPNTLVEACAHGLPVISFDCETGPADIIRDKIDGLLVETGNVIELRVALDCLMVDGAWRRQLGARSLEMRERLSITRVAGMWETLFEELRVD